MFLQCKTQSFLNDKVHCFCLISYASFVVYYKDLLLHFETTFMLFLNYSIIKYTRVKYKNHYSKKDYNNWIKFVIIQFLKLFFMFRNMGGKKGSGKKGFWKKGLWKKGPWKKGSGKRGLKTSKNDHLPKWLEIMKIKTSKQCPAL